MREAARGRADECLGAFGQSELEERVGGAEQKPKSQSTLSISSVVATWMADCYVLGFVPTLRFLQSNSAQTLQITKDLQMRV